MRYTIRTAILVCGLPMLATSAIGQDTASGRYIFQEHGDSLIRMDTETGSISTCTDRAGKLVCQMAADDREAWSDEISQLEKRVADLERRLAEMDGRAPSSSLPSDKEFEETLGFMEKFMRRFFDMARELQQDWSGEKPIGGGDRT